MPTRLRRPGASGSGAGAEHVAAGGAIAKQKRKEERASEEVKEFSLTFSIAQRKKLEIVVVLSFSRFTCARNAHFSQQQDPTLRPLRSSLVSRQRK